MTKKAHTMAAAGDERQQRCRFRSDRCNKFSGDNDLQFCDEHFNFHINFLRNNPSIVKEHQHHLLESETPDLAKNNKEGKMKKERFKPPDEDRCCKTDGVRWRCKNFRMQQKCGAEDCKYCDKHCRSYANQNRKRCRDDDEFELDDLSNSDIDTNDSKCLKLRRKKKPQLTEEDQLAIGEIQPPAIDTSSDGIVGGGSTDFGTGTKRKEVETASSGVLKSLTGISSSVVELESMEHYKTKYLEIELSLGLENKRIELEREEIELKKKEIELEKTKIQTEKTNLELEKKNLELEKKEIEIEKKNVELEKKKTELEKNKVEPEVMKIELEKKNVELEEMKIELGKKNVELEKKNVEYSELHGKYEVESRKNTAKNDEDATQYWRNKCSDLETVVQKMEIENSTMRCEASRVSNTKSLVLRNGNRGSIMRCLELCNSEKIESEAMGLQSEITHTGEKQRDENNMSKPNAESSCGGSKDSFVYDVDVTKHRESESELLKYAAINISSRSLHLSSGDENIEEENNMGCLEERPSEHGLYSQHHLDMSKEPFADLVSNDGGESLGNSEDSDGSADSKNSLGDLMDKLAMKYMMRNDHKEMKWKSEPELLSSFEEDPELCLKAVCALYRQEISEDEASPKGLHFDSDTLRCTTLAKFLMGQDCKGDIKKSLKELETLDSQAVVDCKKLARRYSIHLFEIYQNGKDPFFRPASTSSPGDQTAAS